MQYCYANNITNTGVNSTLLQRATQHFSSFESACASNKIDLNNYCNFFVDNNGRGGVTYFIAHEQMEYSCSTTLISCSKFTGYNWTNDIPNNFYAMTNTTSNQKVGLASSEPTNR